MCNEKKTHQIKSHNFWWPVRTFFLCIRSCLLTKIKKKRVRDEKNGHLLISYSNVESGTLHWNVQRKCFAGKNQAKNLFKSLNFCILTYILKIVRIKMRRDTVSCFMRKRTKEKSCSNFVLHRKWFESFSYAISSIAFNQIYSFISLF